MERADGDKAGLERAVLRAYGMAFLAMLMFTIINAFGLLRVSQAGEQYGLDLHEHGIPAYPEYLVSPSAMPGGMVPGAH